MDKREIIQRDGLNKWAKAGYKGILQWATGVGKTYAAILAIEHISTKVSPPKILIVCPTHTIIKNTKKEFKKFKRTHLLKYCKFICYQSLPKETNTYDLIVLDEIHHCTTEKRLAYLRLRNYRSLLGLTASLTLPQKHLLFPFARVVDTKLLTDMVEEGFVAKFVIINLPVVLTPEEQHLYEELSYEIDEWAVMRNKVHWKAINNRARLLYKAENKIKTASWLTELFPNEYGILFSLTVESSEEISDLVGEKCVAIHSKLPEKEKDLRFKSITDGRTKTRVISAPRIFDEGVSIPRLSYAILFSRYSKERQFIQSLGRIIRLGADTKVAILIRLFVDNTVEKSWVERAQGEFNAITLPLNTTKDELNKIITSARNQP